MSVPSTFWRHWQHRLRQAGEQFAEFTVGVIYDRETGRWAKVYGFFLGLFSRLFSAVVVLRLRLYQDRILRNHHLGCLVIVVGNLTVGGTGKTPVVEKMARSLSERGRRVVILSRGYKSRKEPLLQKAWRALTHLEPPPPKIVSDGRTVLLDSEQAGDEPYMLARNLPGVVVLVDKDRVKAGLYAIKKFRADTIILDDGFQYFALKDHLQLLMIDKTNPFGNRYLLPRGILREPVRHMKRASYIFVTKSDGRPDPELWAEIRRHKPGAEIIECTHRPRYLQTVNNGQQLSLMDLRGRSIAALCAIAAPESFEKFLISAGARLVHHHWFIDHHRFENGELDSFFADAQRRGAEWVITTEKDAVRVPAAFQAPLPFLFLRVEIDILSGDSDFEAAVTRLCFNRGQELWPAVHPVVRPVFEKNL